MEFSSGDSEVPFSSNLPELGRLIVGLALPVYILFIVLPSVFLNALIVLTFIKTKELRTPSNLLSVHVSIIGLLLSLFYSMLSIPAFCLSVIECNCDLSYYKWILAHVFHFALYPLNITAIATSYFLILKFSSHVLTFPRVACVLVAIWVAGIIGNAPTLFVVPLDTFVVCCEGVCRNDTFNCHLLRDSFTPNLFTLSGEIFFIIQDILFIYIPVLLVLVFTVSSYCIFKYSTVHPKSSLKRRMFLLPILMTVSDVMLTVGQNIVNWVPFTTHQNGLPGNVIPFIFGLVWDISGLVYPIIILYFNVHLRKACYSTLMCKYLENQFDRPSSTSKQVTSMPTQDQKREWQEYIDKVFH